MGLRFHQALLNISLPRFVISHAAFRLFARQILVRCATESMREVRSFFLS